MIWIRLINALPRRLALILAAGVGRAIYRISRLTRFRGALERNIRTAFPTRFTDREVKRIAKVHAADLVKSVVEIARFRELPHLVASRVIDVVGIEKLNRAKASGRGIILLSAHMGNWELLIALMGLLGHPAHAVVLRQANPKFNRWIVSERERFGSKALYAGEATSRELTAVLADNGILLLLADHHHYGSEARNIVEFFGKPVSVPAGPVVYARRTGAALLPAFTVRLRRDRHRVIFEEPLELIDHPDPEEAVRLNCRRYIAVFERWITQYPDQWMWSHERWGWLDESLKPRF